MKNCFYLSGCIFCLSNSWLFEHVFHIWIQIWFFYGKNKLPTPQPNDVTITLNGLLHGMWIFGCSSDSEMADLSFAAKCWALHVAAEWREEDRKGGDGKWRVTAQHNPPSFQPLMRNPILRNWSRLGCKQDMKALNGRVMDTTSRAEMRP